MSARFHEVDFGSLKVKFYPLTIGQMQDLEDDLKAMTGGGAAQLLERDRWDKLIRIYTASARRGDPTLTEDVIRQIVDLDNIQEINRTVLGLSGLTSKLKTSGGEVTPTRPQTGAESTPA